MEVIEAHETMDAEGEFEIRMQQEQRRQNATPRFGR